MVVLVAGSNGMVGSAISRKFIDLGSKVVPMSRAEVDILDAKASLEYIGKVRPSLIVLAAAKVGGIDSNRRNPVEFLEVNLQIQHNRKTYNKSE